MMNGVRPAKEDEFTVKGLRNGSDVWVRWSASGLGGDFPTVDLIETEARLLADSSDDRVSREFAGDLAGRTAQELLADRDMAFRLIERVLDRVRTVAGYERHD
jgi:hypothetical protein